jgi:hypothetical protein
MQAKKNLEFVRYNVAVKIGQYIEILGWPTCLKKETLE